MSSAQIPVRFGVAGHTSQGAAQGVVPCRSLHDVSLPHNNETAQEHRVYKAASHALPNASPMIVLGGQSEEIRPREVKGLAPGHKAKGYQG